MLWTRGDRLAPLESLLLREARIFEVYQGPRSSMIAAIVVWHSVPASALLLQGVPLKVLGGLCIMRGGWQSYRMMLRKVTNALSLLLLLC